MNLSQIRGKDKITLSFDVFPPKTEANYEAVKKAALDVAALNPSYMSVTYGAGGSTRANTVQIASAIQQQYGITAISHLTCVGATKEDIDHTLDSMKEAGIENVLALRGDRPKDFEGEPFTDFHYASELVEHIKARCFLTTTSIIISSTGSGKKGSRYRSYRESCRSQERHR